MNNIYQSYYTKSDSIVSYMVRNLNVERGNRIFEPCAGDGVFIEGCLNLKVGNLVIDAQELNPEAFKILQHKFGSNKNITIKHADTLLSTNSPLFSNSEVVYDRIIANPPYGGWQDYDKRKNLKKLYPDLYVKETYGLFLYRCIQLLKDDGILVFIIPDTLYNLHMHTKLRGFILENTKILEISLFPSSFFPGVNFGYSKLSIITLQKCLSQKKCFKNTIRVFTGFESVDQLQELSVSKKDKHTFLQEEIYNNIDHAFFISDNRKVMQLINNSSVKIGDIANCVTGFYSGNDKAFLHSSSNNTRKSNKYKIMPEALKCDDYLKCKTLLNGIEDEKHYVPILKGGGIKYFKSNGWYMDWGIKAVSDYKKSKKARFQNSGFYFKFGVAVPMVSSSSITATLIENKLFDQSIVGIFPKDCQLTYYLLAFFNSPTCNTLIRTINPSANNSANYIKKIPFLTPSKSQLNKINELVKGIVQSVKEAGDYKSKQEHELHKIIKHIHGF